MFATTGNSRHCLAPPKHSKTPLRSRCGRILRSVPPRTRPSSDRKGKRHSKGNRDRRPTNNCKASSTKIRRKVNLVVLATTTGSVGKEGLASCLVVRNRRPAMSKSFRRWEGTMPRGKSDLIDAQV
jgi:hypothetical protein